MSKCPVCHRPYVANTIFCEGCGFYLLNIKEIPTDPLGSEEPNGLSETDSSWPAYGSSAEPLTIRLRIGSGRSPESEGARQRVLEVKLDRPIRLGRVDPAQDIFPDIDLTPDQARQYDVSRQHACIFERDNVVMLEDLGSVNGTQLNGKRLAPYIPESLSDGDQFQLGKLLIEVHFVPRHPPETRTN